MNRSIEPREPAVDLWQLIRLFYPDGSPPPLGDFCQATTLPLPQPFDRLLNHHAHMTVAVESHFDSPVDVKVLRTTKDDKWYAREILLESKLNQQIVQYGIVRIQFSLLASNVWQEIECGQKPLGRVLIEHEVMRQVELVDLWKVTIGERLSSVFSSPTHRIQVGATTYGRTARIFCDSEPAIELLEIVTPAS